VENGLIGKNSDLLEEKVDSEGDGSHKGNEAGFGMELASHW
jgi:hypothetical protein